MSHAFHKTEHRIGIILPFPRNVGKRMMLMIKRVHLESQLVDIEMDVSLFKIRRIGTPYLDFQGMPSLYAFSTAPVLADVVSFA